MRLPKIVSIKQRIRESFTLPPCPFGKPVCCNPSSVLTCLALIKLASMRQLGRRDCACSHWSHPSRWIATNYPEIFILTRRIAAIKLRYCRACYPLSPTPPPEGGGAFLPSPLQGRAKRGGRSRPGERVFWLNLMAVTRRIESSSPVRDTYPFP